MKLFLAMTFFYFFPFSGAFSKAQSSPEAVGIKQAVLTEEAAKDVYIWGFPLVRFERTKNIMTKIPGFGHSPINTFFHSNRLFTPDDKEMLTPLPDTLFSSAFLDLRNGPMVLITPTIKNRFYSL